MNRTLPSVDYGGQTSLHAVFLKIICERFGVDYHPIAESLGYGEIPTFPENVDSMGKNLEWWFIVRLFIQNKQVTDRGIATGQFIIRDDLLKKVRDWDYTPFTPSESDMLLELQEQGIVTIYLDDAYNVIDVVVNEK